MGVRSQALFLCTSVFLFLAGIRAEEWACEADDPVCADLKSDDPANQLLQSSAHAAKGKENVDQQQEESWVWSKLGIGYINRHGLSSHLGNPKAGDAVTLAQKQHIIAMEKWEQAIHARAIQGAGSSLLQGLASSETTGMQVDCSQVDCVAADKDEDDCDADPKCVWKAGSAESRKAFECMCDADFLDQMMGGFW